MLQPHLANLCNLHTLSIGHLRDHMMLTRDVWCSATNRLNCCTNSVTTLMSIQSALVLYDDCYEVISSGILCQGRSYLVYYVGSLELDGFGADFDRELGGKSCRASGNPAPWKRHARVIRPITRNTPQRTVLYCGVAHNVCVRISRSTALCTSQCELSHSNIYLGL